VGDCHLRGVLHEQVHMVLFSVELSQGRPEVRADLRHDLFAQVEHLRGEHTTAILGDDHPVDVQIVDDGAAAPMWVWFRQGCRRPALRCGP